jgi:hypothetical protein
MVVPRLYTTEQDHEFIDALRECIGLDPIPRDKWSMLAQADARRAMEPRVSVVVPVTFEAA